MGVLEIVFLVVVFLYSVVIHEVSHGLMAHSMGDDTAKNLGRLTLNPIKHLDLFGSIILPFLTHYTIGAFFGYAKPVPYNPANLNDRKYGPAKVAFAGPAANLTIAVMFGLLLRFLPSTFGPVFPDLLAAIVKINLLLAVFNLMPIPPLDGHWLLLTILPDRFQAVKLFFLRYGIVLFIFFIIFLFPIIFPLINFLFKVIVG